MQKIEALFRLQSVDLEVDDKTHRLHDVEARLGESPELLVAREAVVQATAALRGAEAALRESEFQVARTDTKLKEVSATLYSGKQSSSRDLANLQKETEQLSLLKSKQENTELEAMGAVEERQAESARAQAVLKEAQAAWQDEQKALAEQESQLQADLARLASARAELLGATDATHLPAYESLRKQKNGRAVAKVEQSICGGCRVVIAVSQVQKARANPGLSFCSSCGRILYVAR
ncbi:MAG: zinc ribbon domain-containing protein [Chloroflexota bacterium]